MFFHKINMFSDFVMHKASRVIMAKIVSALCSHLMSFYIVGESAAKE